MNTYILSIKTSPCVEEFFINEESKFNKNKSKYGIAQTRIELESPTKKELKQTLNAFMTNWCFLH